jgi:hypothetical protein
MTNKEKIEDFINNYGYGDCCLLAEIMAKKYDLNIGVISSETEGNLIHAFVFLNDDYGFDAHGVNKINDIISKYQSFALEHGDENVIIDRYIKDYGLKVLNSWSHFENDYRNFAKNEIEEILNIINFDIEKYKSASIKNKMKP